VTRPHQLPPKASNFAKEQQVVSVVQDETLCEPSAYFDENVCNTTILHKAHMVEQYAIPPKRHLENSETERQTKRLDALIHQVKQDVSLNQSRIGRSKCAMSMTQEVANVTSDSQMPNVTNEELHISSMVTKVAEQKGAAQQPQSELHKLHLLQTLQSLQYLKNLRKPEPNELLSKTVYLPPPTKAGCKKTLIFDLDETLIHCVDDISADPPDVVLPVTFPNGEVVDAGVNIRPGAVECLREVNKSFQVVVFTASHKFYADVVLDHLDPTGELIQYRLYRDSCYQTADGVYVKDLRIIKNRSLKDLVIVDNAVYSFGFQLDNGIPIIPFYNNPEDEELLHQIGDPRSGYPEEIRASARWAAEQVRGR